MTAVAMSGGVDSAVAALLLKERGEDVRGVTLWLHGEENAAAEDAARVCAALDIPHTVLDRRDEFERAVVRNFVEEYQKGRTPNPCVVCNRLIKFGALLDWALEQGAQKLATGHYARTAFEDGRWQLYAAPNKDQSYVLYSLTQRQLAHVTFPLWGMSKAQVRAKAEAAGLAVAHKAESMEACFVPPTGHAAFIEQWTGQPLPPGDFVDEDGRALGRHGGLARYTVGQRKRLGIALGEPRFVRALDAAGNRVVLGDDPEARALIASHMNYISIAPLEVSADVVRDAVDSPQYPPLRVQAKIRYQAVKNSAWLTPLPDNCARITFDAPQRAVTPGQAVVLYDGDKVIGGGTIERAE